jgi:hypothetical protein
VLPHFYRGQSWLKPGNWLAYSYNVTSYHGYCIQLSVKDYLDQIKRKSVGYSCTVASVLVMCLGCLHRVCITGNVHDLWKRTLWIYIVTFESLFGAKMISRFCFSFPFLKWANTAENENNGRFPHIFFLSHNQFCSNSYTPPYNDTMFRF